MPSQLKAAVRTAALSELDEVRLIGALESGDIRLLRVTWLQRQPPNFRIQKRQVLEGMDGSPLSPLMKPAEAVDLVRRGKRACGVLTYGWLRRDHPDPEGSRLAAIRLALRDKALAHIEGLFWE